MDRDNIIIKAGLLGIIVNIFLAIFKLIIGIISNSIAIILDAVNNFSDTLSSIITIIGTKLASKKPDKEHPFGHGRIEYITSTIIAIIVFIAGITALKESIEKTIHPVKANYTVYSLIIIAVAIVVKLVFGNYIKKTGKKISSKSLIATGIDSIYDSVLSLSTLITALISIIANISLEGPLSIIISLIILKSSINIIKDTIDDIIGSRIDSNLAKDLKNFINTFNNVYGTYDLNLANYGPNTLIGSAHIEIPDKMTAKDIHMLTKEISYKVFEKFGIILTIGIYASNDSDQDGKEVKKELKNIIKEYKHVLQIHGFYLDKKTDTIYFDMVIDFEEESPTRLRKEIIKKLQNKYPKYKYIVVIDADISD